MASVTSSPGRTAIAPRTWAAIFTVYAGAFLQGFTLVSFPASSTVLVTAHGFSEAQYGTIFLPQVAFAVAGAVAGGALARRFGLKALLVAGLASNALSQAALAATVWLGPQAAFTAVLTGTACMGLGFGLLGAPLNGYPGQFFPRAPGSAIVAVHTMVGAGLAVGPLLAGYFISHWGWLGFPATLLAGVVALTLLAAALAFPAAAVAGDATAAPQTGNARRSAGFWLLLAIAVLYAFAEGTFSNWAVLFLRDTKGLPEMTAALGLSMFWAALVGGRLLVSVMLVRVAPERIWIALPVIMIVAFELLPLGDSPATGIGLFALAGLGCSAFFPLTVALAQSRHPGEGAWVGSMLIAALMIGVGLGSFIIGPLREWLALERLYQLSALYPALVLVLGALALRPTAHKRTTGIPAHGSLS
ncbi:MAG: MFS transporter [Gammaproteobacteria bacterium]|nr:MFS transporter [Gammaproteobacteria bacterium]